LRQSFLFGGAKATPEMERTADKTVAPFWPVSQAPVLAEVGISGALFFGSFACGELEVLKVILKL
jgi:hypothetical protein